MSHLDEGQLNALLDGELDEAERKAAEAHLESCAECRREYTEVRAMMAGADDLIAAVELPARSGPAAVAPKARPTAFRWRNVAWAASVVLAVGLGWLARADERYAFESGRLAKGVADAAPAAPQAAPAPVTLGDSFRAQAKERDEAASGGRAAQVGSVGRRAAQPTAPPRQNESPAAGVALSTAPAKPEASAPAPASAIEKKDAPVANTDALRALTNPADKRSDDAGADSSTVVLAEERQLARKTAQEAPAAPAAEVPSAKLQSVPSENVVSGFAGPARAKVAGRDRESEAFRATPMEAAVRILGGSIRLVDGMTPTRVMVGPGVLVSGADPRLEIVRVVYNDPPGRELWLDQQRPQIGMNEADGKGSVATTLLPGDTLVVIYKTGERGLRWIHQSGFRLGLTGFLPADSLRALARRVQ